MATYATQVDFVQFVPGFVIEDVDALEQLLLDAENDIDAAVGRGNVIGDNRKFDLDLMTDNEAYCLMRATCAQAEYRLHMGEQFFIEGRQKEVTGRDAKIQGPLPYIGPKAKIELTRGRLWKLNGRLSGVALPNQNVDDIIP
jgi:hypothetical protein